MTLAWRLQFITRDFDSENIQYFCLFWIQMLKLSLMPVKLTAFYVTYLALWWQNRFAAT